jgi:putative ABC transport system permease protein
MIVSDLKSAIRGIRKKKTFFLINVLGLSIGMAACLVILHYAAFESSFDKFLPNGERLYRVRGGDRADGSQAIGQAMKASFPEIEDYVKIGRTGARGVYALGETHIRRENAFSVTSSFLNVFPYRLLQGDRSTALAEPNSIVVTESTARTYFGSADPMGKTLRFNGAANYKITGVLADIPANSHLKFDLLLSWATVRARIGEAMDNSWVDWGAWTYVLLKPGTGPRAFQEKLTAFVKLKQKEVNQPESFWELYHLQPVTDIHLYSAYVYEAGENGNGNAIRLLIIVAVLIIVLAWCNYINLSTARSAERAREVGIRKVAGAGRRELIRQFLTEAGLVNLIAAGAAFLLVQMSLPAFARLTGIPADFVLWNAAGFWAALAGVLTVGTLLSGLYPAFILSGFRPASMLKDKLGPTSRGALLRKGLVVFQFAVSAGLIAGTFTIYRQVVFMVNGDLGVDYARTLVLRRPMAVADRTREDIAARTESFKAELRKIPGVGLIARSSNVPGDDVGPLFEGKKPDLPKEATIDVYEIACDPSFIPLYGLKLKAGRNFSETMGTDASAIILNETALKRLGYADPQAAVNQPYTYRNSIPLTIIGVLADYHQESLKTNYEPLALSFRGPPNGDYSIRFLTRDASGIVAGVKKAWARFYPGNPFEYFFLDEHFHRLYNADRQFLKVFGIFALLAILVACLGLFGLSLFNTLRRTKEIGIRRVLGASLAGLVVLLMKDFSKLIALSNLIAFPLFLFFIRDWLNRFAFRIGVEWWFFLVPLVLIFAVSTLVVVFHSIRISAHKPAGALRYE